MLLGRMVGTAVVLDDSGKPVEDTEAPEAPDGYSTGDRVTHGGHLWESLVDDNVDRPGTDNGFRWKDLGAWPAEETE